MKCGPIVGTRNADDLVSPFVPKNMKRAPSTDDNDDYLPPVPYKRRREDQQRDGGEEFIGKLDDFNSPDIRGQVEVSPDRSAAIVHGDEEKSPIPAYASAAPPPQSVSYVGGGGEMPWMEPNAIDFNESPYPPSVPAPLPHHERTRTWPPPHWHSSYSDPSSYYQNPWVQHQYHQFWPPRSTMSFPPHFQPPLPSVSNDQEPEQTPSLSRHDSQDNMVHAPNQYPPHSWHSPLQQHEISATSENMQQYIIPSGHAVPMVSHRSRTAPHHHHHPSSTEGYPEPPTHANTQLRLPPVVTLETQREPSPSPDGAVPLSIPSDDEHLSEYHCLVRAQIDLFAAGEADFQSNMQGRNRPIVRNQVGLRCRHCAKISPPNRRAPGAVYYPSKLSGLYQAAVNMAKNHFMVSCQKIPSDIKARLSRLKEKKTYMLGGGKGYWSTGGRIRNVIEVENRLFFEQSAPAAVEGGDSSGAERTDE